MTASRLLIVDDEPRIRDLLARTLRKNGFEVETADDGRQALECAERSMPDLVVTDIMMPRMDGWTFVRRFRSMPGSALVPVIFLTALGSDRHRMNGFRLGADEYLTKPFKNKELQRRIQAALERRRQFQSTVLAPATDREPVGIRGTLDQVGLASLLTLLEMEQRSGTLDVRRNGEGDSAAVHVRDGHVVRVTVDERADLKGPEAAYELLTWGEGAFEFRPRTVDDPDEVNAGTAALLLEAARRMDEETEIGDG